MVMSGAVSTGYLARSGAAVLSHTRTVSHTESRSSHADIRRWIADGGSATPHHPARRSPDGHRSFHAWAFEPLFLFALTCYFGSGAFKPNGTTGSMRRAVTHATSPIRSSTGWH